MLANHSHERLLALRLTGMAKAFDDQLRQPDIDKLSFEQRLGLMIDRETTERDNRRLVTRLKFAALRQTAVIEDIDLRASRGIDRSFLAQHEKQRALLRGMIALAQGCGLRVAVEGVETADHHLLLQELGCDLLQGFLFARPMLPEQIDASLNSVAELPYHAGVSILV